jgi:enoyl-CoA hydratase/carnithine racemase
MTSSEEKRLENVILKEIRGEYAILTLSHKKVNAIDTDLCLALQMRFRQLVVDRVRGVIVTGKPGLFSAGLDIPYLAGLTSEQLRQWNDLFFNTVTTIVSSPLIAIAAISGHSPAGGAVMALSMDYRIMAKGKYSIGLNEVAIGLPLSIGITTLAENTLGHRNAERVVLTGRMWPVEEALKIGFVDETIDESELMKRSETLMKQWIATTKAAAFAKTKKAMRASLVAALEEERAKLTLGSPEFAAVFKTFKEDLKKRSAEKQAKAKL